MNTLYLICSGQNINQVEIPYLLNNSPMLHGESQAGEHWENSCLRDNCWNISEEDKNWYDNNIRNAIEISEEQFNGLLNLIKDKSISVLLHAQNYEDIWKWSRNLPVMMIRTEIDGGEIEWDSPGDVLLAQDQWTTLDGLDTLWNTIGIDKPDQNWIHQYYEDFKNHQGDN